MKLPEEFDDPQEWANYYMDLHTELKKQELIELDLRECVDYMQDNLNYLVDKLDVIEDDDVATDLTQEMGIYFGAMMKAIIHFKKTMLLYQEQSFLKSIKDQKPDLN